jgi:hypothetical protein
MDSKTSTALTNIAAEVWPTLLGMRRRTADHVELCVTTDLPPKSMAACTLAGMQRCNVTAAFDLQLRMVTATVHTDVGIVIKGVVGDWRVFGQTAPPVDLDEVEHLLTAVHMPLLTRVTAVMEGLPLIADTVSAANVAFHVGTMLAQGKHQREGSVCSSS